MPPVVVIGTGFGQVAQGGHVVKRWEGGRLVTIVDPDEVRAKSRRAVEKPHVVKISDTWMARTDRVIGRYGAVVKPAAPSVKVQPARRYVIRAGEVVLASLLVNIDTARCFAVSAKRDWGVAAVAIVAADSGRTVETV